MKTTSMEEDLKILKVEYLWNNSFYKSLKWKQPLMEDDLQILKVEYLHLLDHTQILNLS